MNSEVQSLAIFGLENSVNGITCCNIGYAVKEDHRGRGLAIETVTRAIKKMKIQLARENIKSFIIEAVIARDNHPSLSVARRLFRSQGVPALETESGTLSFHFQRLISI